ncbi:MAG: glutathione peroxidase [Acidobacteriota bacterium]
MLAARNSIFAFTAKAIDGQSVSLGDYRGQVMLIVNVASRCGYTPQYRGLEDLYRRYREHGLVVLGFPCDQFGHQEPGTEAEIRDFCSLTYDVTFPMFSKVKVNGDDADPVYGYLKAQKKGLLGSEGIKWNFTKFLVDRQGKVVRRFAPADTPETIEREIVPLLALPT